MDKNFPRDLLLQPVGERINYFKKKSVAHPTLVNSYINLMEKVEVVEEGKVLLVYGPSGVGKTTLFAKVKNEYLQRYHDEMVKDKGLIPVLAIEAFANEDGKFDWINFYTEALEELKDILIDEKRLPLNELGVELPNNPNEKTKRKLRKSLENAIKCRKVKVILIDEAQHLTKVGNSKGLRNHMDSIKSLAAKFNVPIILFGTYELLSFRNLNGQLGRRTMEVHFPRYNSEEQRDIDAFKNVLWFFQKAFPLQQEPNLVDEWKYFYRLTIGCVGTLKDWLDNTYDYIMENNVETKILKIRDFKKFEPTIDQAYIMAKEITSGEKSLTEKRKEKEGKLDALLKLDQLDDIEVKKKNGNKRPGERKSKRDKTGTDL
ncbi:AAA family ATPase [Paucisalibacillus sp. EB02]|uniref:AAA family ATPase n=1 Tax=Paucisalibacillus sp. EB02 TaxID=1347087 RepID=UPI0004BCED4B|nr:AAA family ATPase [Paucisalibacillus sp. EB02]